MFQQHSWTRHSKGLSYDGRSICLNCQIELPAILPVNQTVCTKEDRLYLGDIQDAVDCHAI